MCGLFGLYTPQFFVKDEKDLFRLLMVANYLRGVDSTGVIKVSRNDQIFYDKVLSPSPVAAFDPEFMGIVEENEGYGSGPLALLGHTRWKTVGSKDIKNAHPFITKNYVGMHNGTIWEDFEGSKEFGTDSEGLYNLIQNKGLFEALSIINRECYLPAYALQMVENITNEDNPDVIDPQNTIRFIRNDERSLWFTVTSSGSTLAWSSDPTTLRWAIHQTKHKSHKATWVTKAFEDGMIEFHNKDESSNVFQILPQVHMSILSGEILAKTKFEKFKMPEYKYGGRQRVLPFTDSMETGTNTNIQSLRKKKKVSLSEQELAQTILLNMRSTTGTIIFPPGIRMKRGSSKIPSIKTLFQNYKGYSGRIMKKKEVLSRLSDGCSTCGISVNDNDPIEISSIKWIARDKWVCSACQSVYTDKQLHDYAQT